EERRTGKRIESRWRVNWLDRDELPPEVDQALDVLEDIDLRVSRLDLTDKAVRNGFWNGLRLATAVGHLNHNMVLERPVQIGISTSKTQSERAKKPRNRRPALWLRGLQCVLRDEPS